ncbi:MAG TPA: hypothetical protein ENH70_05735 [Desulfobacteraceae bacterium]|nr:MAG: hypothetical protein DRG82_13490 [Deltaproteobacteria bacterium]HDZ24023.1 hypothetical protein [Desulfobacteraceae bacterium]
MIKNSKKLKGFEKNFLKNRGNLTHEQALKLFTAMWEEARSLGLFPSKDLLEGIDVDIRIAKALNSCLKNSSPE